MSLQSMLTGAAILIAVAALLKARWLARRVERLSESYWELRYEHAQLRGRVNRLDPEPPGKEAPESRQSGADAFVPLSSLRR